MSKFEETFETVDIDGNKIELIVQRPNGNVLDEGTKVFFDTFNHARKVLKSPLRLTNRNQLKEDGIWSDEKEEELKAIEKQIKDLSIRLTKVKKKADGRSIALKIRKLRSEHMLLQSQSNYLDNMTCETQAENKRFDYWVASCVVRSDTLEPYFKDLEDYEKRREEKAATDSFNAMVKLMFNVEGNPQKEYPENKFLLKHKLCNENLELIDKDGHLCDEDYKRIKIVNDSYYYVNDNDEIIDDSGNPLNEDGTLKLEFPDLED